MIIHEYPCMNIEPILFRSIPDAPVQKTKIFMPHQYGITIMTTYDDVLRLTG